MPNYGIVDLGSNTIRLCVYCVNTKSNVKKQPNIKTLLDHRLVAGLASFIEDGKISNEGINRAVSCLKDHSKSLAFFKCQKIAIFATAVLRNCTNSKEAISKIESDTGIKIDLLSADNEARLGFIGAKFSNKLDNGVLLDIGGGSSELSRIENADILDTFSIPIGSLTCFANNVKSILPSKKETANLKDYVLRTIDNHAQVNSFKCKNMFGIGGGTRAAFKVYAGLFNNNNKVSSLNIKQIDEILDYAQKQPDEFAHRILKICPDRIHTFIPACIILREVFVALEADQISSCKYGLREGYLLDKMLG